MDFEKYIENVKSSLVIKKTIDVEDIVIICLTDMVLFGKVIEITKDSVPKRDIWWVVKITIFAIPITVTSFTLREEQMLGLEIFTINAKPHYLAPIDINVLLTKDEPKKPNKTANIKNLKKSFLRVVK